MTVSLRKIYSLITPQERKQVYWLLLAIMVMGILQTTGIASIMPFMAVLANPEVVQTNKYLSQAYILSGLTTHNQFLFFLGIMVLLFLVISNIFSALTMWLLMRFGHFYGHALSSKLLGKYLNTTYPFFLTHNSSELTKNITTETYRVAAGILLPTMMIIARSVIVLCIFVLLIAMEPLLAIIVFIVCGGLYATVFKLTKKKLATNGKKSTEAQGQRFKITGEALGGIKELKVLGREEEYLRRYSKPSYNFATFESSAQAIMIWPKYVLETITFGGILLIIIYLTGIKNDIDQIIPILVLYAFAGYRLMPAFDAIFQGISQIRYHTASLDIVHSHLDINYGVQTPSRETIPARARLQFSKSIELKDVTFSYNESNSTTFKKLNLFIAANTTVAFVGTTGSGKTTLVDIIMGLLPLDSGEIFIDNALLESTEIQPWQRNIGYVPQQIYLADDTVTRNIAFGVPDKDIDQQKVLKAARLANIDDFVSKELNYGYETYLGERGVRLSGGQRQRIGIARALYHDPNVLILDEATSALDGVTENVIMEAIHNLAHRKTIILIAHRLSTVKQCDSIYLLDRGKIATSGTYDELVLSSAQFREMAGSEKSEQKDEFNPTNKESESV